MLFKFNVNSREERSVIFLICGKCSSYLIANSKTISHIFHKSTWIFVCFNASFCIELNNNKFNIKNIITFHMQLEIFATVFLIQESCIVDWTCTSPSWAFIEDKYSLFIENMYVGLMNKDCFNNHHQKWIICPSRQRTGYYFFFKYRTCTKVIQPIFCPVFSHKVFHP